MNSEPFNQHIPCLQVTYGLNQNAFCHNVRIEDADLLRQRHHLFPETLQQTLRRLLPDADRSDDSFPYRKWNEGC